jgi:hypothetical protein
MPPAEIEIVPGGKELPECNKVPALDEEFQKPEPLRDSMEAWHFSGRERFTRKASHQLLSGTYLMCPTDVARVQGYNDGKARTTRGQRFDSNPGHLVIVIGRKEKCSRQFNSVPLGWITAGPQAELRATQHDAVED